MPVDSKRSPVTIAITCGLLVLAVTSPRSGSAPEPCPGPDPPIIAATAEGDLAAVNALIASGADVNVKDEEGMTALLHAAIYGYYDVLVALVDAGANLETVCRNGWTPLTYAEEAGFTRGAQYLTVHGADIEHRTREGYTPLCATVCGGRHLDYDESHHDTVLLEPLKRGANVHTTASGQMTLLMIAVEHRRIDLVRLLLNAGVDRDIANYKGETALAIARRKQYGETAAVLTTSAYR